MAIKELFYDQRPVALLNAKASQRIDPRFAFTRNGEATYVDTNGKIKIAGPDEPRFDSDPLTGEKIGLLIEEARTNFFTDSQNIVDSAVGGKWLVSTNVSLTSNAGTAPDGTNNATLYQQITPCSNAQARVIHTNDVSIGSNTQYVFSFFAKLDTSATQNLIGFRIGTSFFSEVPTQAPNFFTRLFTFDSNGEIIAAPDSPFAGYQKYANGWYRLWVSVYVFTTGVNIIPLAISVGGESGLDPTTYGKFLVWGAQFENTNGSTTPDSFIYTPTSATAARPADLLSIEASIPDSGSLYVDARAIGTGTNSTLASIKNNLNQKINLSIEELPSLYGSPALVYSVQGTAKTTLPFPVPTTSRERNIITWGSNNYQYGTGTARFAQSLSSSVPANLNQLSIGHDSVDPTKGFNGYINAVYLYSGEITPVVAEALVRGELDPVNADSFVPAGPAGSLSLIINTQGAGATGDKVFTLPANSVASNNDIVISWGDQTESGLEGAAAQLNAPGLTKIYSSAGIYSVFVEGVLENLSFNNSSSAADLVQIQAWGTGANGNDVFRSPSTMASAFYGCTQLDFSSSAKTTNIPDTSAVTNWNNAFRDCGSITGLFPPFNFSSAVSFSRAFQNCASLTSFTAAGNQTQNVTNFEFAWDNCSSLTSFPLINTSSATNMFFTWNKCSSLTSFPPIDTSSVTELSFAWANCGGLTSFPAINTSNVVSMQQTWISCNNLTAFPFIDTSNVTNMANTWYGCASLTAFPVINTGNVTNFGGTWIFCGGLLSFPLLDTSKGTNFRQTWRDLVNITAFPQIITSAGTNFSFTWYQCRSLATFPSIDTSSGTTFYRTWTGCLALTSFPSLDFSSATGLATDASNVETGFFETWANCTSLTTFPANRFDSTVSNRFLGAWTGCALTAQSIENILTSLVTAGQNDGNLGIGGGTNAGQSTWSVTANNAFDTLVNVRNWTITFNP